MSTLRTLRVPIVVAGAVSLLPLALAADETKWFVPFERIAVANVARSDTTQLVEAGVIDTDGFSDLVFSLGGEFKDGPPEGGRVGALLIPDLPPFQYLLRNEGQIVFPLEVIYTAKNPQSPIFVSEQQTARVAFPRYRVFMYNETGSAAVVSLYVYRIRR